MPLRDRKIGYCTNVHAGADLAATKENLRQHALEVKRRFQPSQPMGVGLWLAAPAARDLIQQGKVPRFAQWLDEAGLNPFTLNGFPYGDFHQAVVKHKVYLPRWEDEQREVYTRNLVTILDGLLPEGQSGSISTLPLAWGTPALAAEQMQASASRLLRIAQHCAELEQATGRLITICIEPEPGCALQTSTDITRFFEQYLFTNPDQQIARRYLRVCHDVCHAAVMFEPQREVLKRYRAAGIQVGKVQISSAVCLHLDPLAAADRRAAIKQLAQFSEDRYLHQTMVRQDGKSPTFYEDLPLALRAEAQGDAPTGEWRVHFHVPVYLKEFGHLGTSQHDILECLAATKDDAELTHFEVETYAWGVLPETLQQESLAAGIAEEMRWFATSCNAQASG